MSNRRLHPRIMSIAEVMFFVIPLSFCSLSYGGKRLEMKDVFTREEQVTLYNMPREPGNVWEKRTRFVEAKLRRTSDPDHILFLKVLLASEYPAIKEFKKAHHLLDEVRTVENAPDIIRGAARYYEVRCYTIEARYAETRKKFLEFRKKADDLAGKYLTEFKEKGWNVEMYSEMLSELREEIATTLNKDCYSEQGRFLPYSERKRMQEEALKKEREKREQEAKKAGAPGGAAPTSGTLTKGGLRSAAAASGCGCGCGSDPATSATKSAASCGGCGSGDASPKPASSPPGGGCGCGSAQPATSTQPAAKPAGSSASSSGCGCGSPQPAAKPAGSAASSGGCGCGSAQPAAKPAESSAGGGGCGCGAAQPAANPAPPKGAGGQPAPRPGTAAQ